MVLTVSLLIIITLQLKGMVSVSQSLIRIFEGTGHDIIPGLYELAHMVYSHQLFYLRNSDSNSGIARCKNNWTDNYLCIFAIENLISVQQIESYFNGFCSMRTRWSILLHTTHPQDAKLKLLKYMR